MYCNRMKLYLSCIALLFLMDSGFSLSMYFNRTEFLSRRKRWLIFNEGGTNKMVFGALYPLYLEDPIKWRQVNCAYNLHAQYAVPTVPTYPWNKWKGRSLQEAREKFDKTGIFGQDDSRKLAYMGLEIYMNNQGKNGRKCLLRTICENAQVEDHHGIYSEILNAVLTPGKEELHDDYRMAYSAGLAMINCLTLYPECPLGDSFIDLISYHF